VTDPKFPVKEKERDQYGGGKGVRLFIHHQQKEKKKRKGGNNTPMQKEVKRAKRERKSEVAKKREGRHTHFPQIFRTREGGESGRAAFSSVDTFGEKKGLAY